MNDHPEAEKLHAQDALAAEPLTREFEGAIQEILLERIGDARDAAKSLDPGQALLFYYLVSTRQQVRQNLLATQRLDRRLTRYIEQFEDRMKRMGILAAEFQDGGFPSNPD